MVTRRRVLGFTALAAATTLLLAVAWPEEQKGGARVVGKDPRILVPRNPENFHGLAALGGARLRYYVPDRCLVLDNRNDASNEPVITTPPPSLVPWSGVVWPYGTTVAHDGARVGVRLKDGRTIWAGDEIAGGGGSVTTDENWAQRNHGMSATCTTDLTGIDSVHLIRH